MQKPPPSLGLDPPRHEDFVELVDGLLLGDGSIRPNGILSVTQSNIRIGWINQIQRSLKRFGCAAKRVRIPAAEVEIGGKTIFRAPSVYLYTARCAELATQRHRWYPTGTKRVPHNVRITPVSLAQWFAGDGSGSATGTLTFNTQCFTASEVDRLIDRLPIEAKRFDAYAKKLRRDQYVIIVGRCNEALKLSKIIRRHLPQCCQYKLQNVRSVQEPRRNSSAQTVRRIREMAATGEWTQQQIADYFSYKQPEISRIVRRVNYRHLP